MLLPTWGGYLARGFDFVYIPINFRTQADKRCFKTWWLKSLIMGFYTWSLWLVFLLNLLNLILQWYFLSLVTCSCEIVCWMSLWLLFHKTHFISSWRKMCIYLIIFGNTWLYCISHTYALYHNIIYIIMGELLYNTGIILYDVISLYIYIWIVYYIVYMPMHGIVLRCISIIPIMITMILCHRMTYLIYNGTLYNMSISTSKYCNALIQANIVR